MPIDASIALQTKGVQLDSPMDIAAKAQQYQAMQQQNRLAELSFGKQQQETDATNALNRLYQTATKADGTVDRSAIYNGLAQGGMGSRIPGMQKQFADADKATADVGHVNAQTGELKGKTANKQQEAIGQTLGSLAQIKNPTAQHVTNGVQHLVDIGMIQPEMAQKIIAGVPQDPSQIQAWLTQGRNAVMSAKDQRSYTEADANATLGSQTSIANNTANNRTSIQTTGMNNATSRANNSAQIGATMRGQDMTNSRAKDTLSQGKVPSGYRANADGSLAFIPGGPADPNTKDKAPTEYQAKAAGFGARAEQSDKILTTIAGQYSPAAVNAKNAVQKTPIVGGLLGSAVNKFSMSSNDQVAEQAQRDFINANLRLESGATIGPDEFESAKLQYFPQPGDGAAVLKTKADNRKLVIKSLKAGAGKAAFSSDASAPGSDIHSQAEAILKGK